MRFLVALMKFLRFDAQGRNRARLKALDADRLVRFLAIAIFIAFDPEDRRVDFGDRDACTAAVAPPVGEYIMGRSHIIAPPVGEYIIAPPVGEYIYYSFMI